MNNFITNATVKLNEIAVSMLLASSTQQSCVSSVKMICTLDELLNTQYKNSLNITLNSFKYISLKENKSINFPKMNIDKIIYDDSFIKKKSDSFRTLAFILFDIIILLNDSIENEKILEPFFPNFVKAFNKLFIFEKQHLQCDISIKALEKIMFN